MSIIVNNNLPITDARGVFTRQLVKVWDELSELKPKQFLSSFFEKRVTDTKEISIQVRRGTEYVASDVLRGSNGNRNTISRSSEKMFIPPFYNEFFDATELDKYDLIFGMNATDVPESTYISVVSMAVEKITFLRHKIERAYELQAAQVFESGIVRLDAGTNIDFKRKAGSIVDLTNAGYWDNPSVDPEKAFVDAAIFLRTIGKATDGVFNVILGAKALTAWKKNPNVKQQNYNIYIKLIDLHMPQANAEGGILHGQYAAGSYLFNIWSYPEFYQNSAGNMVPYIDDNLAIFLPANSGEFIISHAAVPAIVKDARNMQFPELISNVATDFLINNYIDPFAKKHVFEVLSSGLTVPVSVDRIYTMIASGSNTENN